MNRVGYIALYRVVFALVALFTISYQLGEVINAGDSVVNFFSFFTIQSNLIAALFLLALAYCSVMGCRIKHMDFWHGAVTSYMVITGIIYILFLAGLDDSLQTPVWWANLLLHYILPLVLLIDWIIHKPQDSFSYKQSTEWLVYPVAFGLFSLLRGYYSDWYPYPFLSPDQYGYSNVVILSVPILLGIYGVIASITKIHIVRSQTKA